MNYLYEGHMGCYYWTLEEQEYEDLYCETCGDCDFFLGTFETEAELKELIMGGHFAEEYCEKILEEFRLENNNGN